MSRVDHKISAIDKWQALDKHSGYISDIKMRLNKWHGREGAGEDGDRGMIRWQQRTGSLLIAANGCVACRFGNGVILSDFFFF